MFIVKNSDGITLSQWESFNGAKEDALKLKADHGENFIVEEIKQVWTTQTLDEAMKEKLKMWTVIIVHRNNRNIPPRITTRNIIRLDDLKQTVEDAVKIDEVELIELSSYD